MGRKKQKSKEILHFDCIPCRRCIRSRRQWMEHLEGKIHVNGVIDYALKYGISAAKASELAFETIVPMSEDEVVIAAFRCKGISIPLDVKNVENVQRNRRSLLVQQYREVKQSCILVEEGKVSGIILFDFFDFERSQEYFRLLFWLNQSSGVVSRQSKKKKGGNMMMWGSRICHGIFDHYKQSKTISVHIDRTEKPAADELERVASYIASDVFAIFERDLYSWALNFQRDAPITASTALARLGRSPFTTMGATVNYWANKHVDEVDFGFGVIAWFEEGWTGTGKRSEFRLCDYGISFQPKRGTLILFKTSEVAHQTVHNKGYTQIGLAFAVKKLLLNAGEVRMANLGFSANKDGDWEKFL